MKRTKRYGGFCIGDKIKHKKYGLGRVVGYLNGCIYVWFDKFDDDAGYFGQTIAPNQLINLTRQQEERTNGGIGTIPPKTKLVVLEDLSATPFKDKVIGNIQEARLKLAKLQDKELKAAKDFVDEALRQTEIFISPLSPYGDPLPSPYTRDVYCSSLDYML